MIIGGKRKEIQLNNNQQIEILKLYGISEVSPEDVVSFKQISYNRYYANVLIINKKVDKETLLNNNNIEKIEKIDKIGIPYPNNKYIPYKTEKCCCFYDDKYYYLSAFNRGSEYNNAINSFFWENYLFS